MTILEKISAALRSLCSARSAPAPACMSEEEICGHIRRGLTGELEVKLEPGMRAGVQLLTIEPKPGVRIVVGTSAKGKSSLTSSRAQIGKLTL